MGRPADRRAKIELLRAAETVFVEHGLAEAKVEDITARAGVSKGAFYLHFEGKEDCFKQIVEGFVAKLAACLDESPPPMSMNGSGSLPDLLAHWHAHDCEIFEFCWQNRGLMEVLFSGAGGQAYRYLVDEFAERTANQIQELGAAAHRRGHLPRRPRPRRSSPPLMSGAYERLLVRDLIKRPKPARRRGLVAAGHDALFMRGLSSRTKRGRFLTARSAPPPKPWKRRDRASRSPAIERGTNEQHGSRAPERAAAGHRGHPGDGPGGGALFALIGVRVKETMADRKAQAGALAEQVKSAPAKAGAAVVHGKARQWRPSIPVTGTLSPVQDAEIGFKTGGRLVSVRVKVGDRVRAGQPLASLDVSEASAQAAATAAGVRAAKVSYDMAKDAEKRTLALFEQHAVSDAENLAAQNRAALALAQLEQARAQSQLAAVGVGNGSLAAPFAGLVTRTPNGVGKIVAPSETLFHVEDTSVLKLTATLSEADARLVEGRGARLLSPESSAGPGAEGAPAAKGQATDLTGKVTAVLSSLDANTRRGPRPRGDPQQRRHPLAGRRLRARHHHLQQGGCRCSSSRPPRAPLPAPKDEVVVVVGGKAHLRRVVFTPGEGGALLVRGGLDAAGRRPPDADLRGVREGDDLSGAAAN